MKPWLLLLVDGAKREKTETYNAHDECNGKCIGRPEGRPEQHFPQARENDFAVALLLCFLAMEAYVRTLVEKNATLFDVLCDCTVRSLGDPQWMSVKDAAGGAEVVKVVKVVGFHRSIEGVITARLEDGSVIDACDTLLASRAGDGVGLGMGVVDFVERLGAEKVFEFVCHATSHAHIGECAVVLPEAASKTTSADIRTMKRDVGKHISALWERITALEQTVAVLVTQKRKRTATADVVNPC